MRLLTCWAEWLQATGFTLDSILAWFDGSVEALKRKKKMGAPPGAAALFIRYLRDKERCRGLEWLAGNRSQEVVEQGRGRGRLRRHEDVLRDGVLSAAGESDSCDLLGKIRPAIPASRRKRRAKLGITPTSKLRKRDDVIGEYIEGSVRLLQTLLKRRPVLLNLRYYGGHYVIGAIKHCVGDVV